MKEYFPPIQKKIKKIEIKGKWKERKGKIESYYLLFTLHLIYTGGWLLVLFDNNITTFKNKNDRFNCNVKKILNKLPGLWKI